MQNKRKRVNLRSSYLVVLYIFYTVERKSYDNSYDHVFKKIGLFTLHKK